MTDDQRARAVQAIMVAMWHVEAANGESVLSMVAVTESEKAQRREWAETALDRVLAITSGVDYGTCGLCGEPLVSERQCEQECHDDCERPYWSPGDG